MITQLELKEQLDYNPETGVFTRKVSNANRVKIGDVAGCLDNTGYLKISIKNKRYLAHRLAWFYIHGEWPKGQIDHINGNTLDNRIINLRDVSHCENQQNRSTHRQGRLVGTTYNKQCKKWVSQIYINGKRKHLGYFNTEQRAHEEYLKELNKLD